MEYKPHILFVLDHFYPYVGGGETLFFQLTRGLVKKGYLVTVVTSRYDQNLDPEEIMDGVRVMRVGSNRINFQRLGFFKARQLIKESKQHTHRQIDLIHASTFFSIIPGRLLRQVTGIKTLLTVHEVYGKLRFQFLGRKGCVNYLYECFCMSLLRFDYYMCVSNYTKNCLRISYGMPDDKLRTVYLGIDYDFWNREKLDKEHIEKLKIEHQLESAYVGLYFGRMGVAKGMNDILQALPEIIKHIPNYKQVFITPKKQAQTILGLKNSFSLEEIEQYIQKHKLSDHIVRIESVPRAALRDWISMADITILPSRAEGFGFAVSEVCTLERNLITTSVASIPEVVYGNINFVEPGNPHDIAEKVQDFYKGKFEIVPKKVFLWKDCVEKMEGVYSELTWIKR